MKDKQTDSFTTIKAMKNQKTGKILQKPFSHLLDTSTSFSPFSVSFNFLPSRTFFSSIFHSALLCFTFSLYLLPSSFNFLSSFLSSPPHPAAQPTHLAGSANEDTTYLSLTLLHSTTTPPPPHTPTLQHRSIRLLTKRWRCASLPQRRRQQLAV